MFPHHLHGQVWQVAKARPLGVPVLAGGATCLPALLGTPRSSKGHLRGTASGVCQPWVLGRVGKRPEEQPRDLAPWPAVSAESLRHCTKALQSWPVALWGRRAGNCMLQRGEHCQSGSGRHGTWGPKGQRQVCAPASSTGRHVGPEAGRTAEPARDWRGQPHPCWPGAHTTLCLAAPPPSCSCFCDLGGFA